MCQSGNTAVLACGNKSKDHWSPVRTSMLYNSVLLQTEKKIHISSCAHNAGFGVFHKLLYFHYYVIAFIYLFFKTEHVLVWYAQAGWDWRSFLLSNLETGVTASWSSRQHRNFSDYFSSFPKRNPFFGRHNTYWGVNASSLSASSPHEAKVLLLLPLLSHTPAFAAPALPMSRSAVAGWALSRQLLLSGNTTDSSAQQGPCVSLGFEEVFFFLPG